MHRLVVAALWLLAGGAATAAPALLDDDALKHLLPGKTVHLDTPLGVSIPITYHANGLMSGRAGMLSYILGADNDRGRWWVEHGKLCQKWFKWLDAKPNCMRVRLDGPKVYWQADDGTDGTATVTAGLAAGAAAPPRGLGGPARESPERDARPVPVTAHDTSADDGPAGKARRRTPVVAAAAWSVPAPVRVARPDAGKAPASVDEDVIEVPAERASAAIDWCRTAVPPIIDAGYPTLVAVTRQVLGVEAAPATDCFAVEPSLVSM
ncbi:MAG TPA: hypothetical protein VJ740_02840, partial [Hyphomicrobiaceae bacterium]|nr:hypothetical protein [Hyphomicrobiaceae bacterium]